MFGKFTEQVKKSSQPMGSLVAFNTKMLESFSQQQTEFFTGLMADSVKYVESISVQTEVKGVIAAQSVYAEAVKERLAHTSKETYGKMNEIRDEYTAVLKSTMNDMPSPQDVAQEMAKASVSNKPTAAPVKPAAPKTTAKKAAPKGKPVAKKTTTKPAKPAVKTASISAPNADTKASVKTAPKPAVTAPKAETKTPEVKAAPVNAANTPAPQTRVAPTKNTSPAPKTAAKK